MARSLNKVLLIGNLGKDPEVRTTGTGQRVANFSLATSRQWNDQSGAKQEKTEWHRCVVWGKLAEVVEKYVKKGDRIYVEGTVEYGQYQDKDGQTRYTTDINIRELVMLGGSGGGDSAQADRAKAPARGAKKESDFEDFPGALNDEDDDLPF